MRLLGGNRLGDRRDIDQTAGSQRRLYRIDGCVFEAPVLFRIDSKNEVHEPVPPPARKQQHAVAREQASHVVERRRHLRRRMQLGGCDDHVERDLRCPLVGKLIRNIELNDAHMGSVDERGREMPTRFLVRSRNHVVAELPGEQMHQTVGYRVGTVTELEDAQAPVGWPEPDYLAHDRSQRRTHDPNRRGSRVKMVCGRHAAHGR